MYIDGIRDKTGTDLLDTTVHAVKVVAPAAATGLGKAEDTLHTSGDIGVMVLAVRKDAAIALASTDGDYIPLIVDADGRLHVKNPAVPCASGDVHEPAANTAAVVTYAAQVGLRHCISGVAWSYSAAPTGGNLKIEDVAGTTVFIVDITEAGLGGITLPFPKKSVAANTAMIITLAAGGAGITGKLSVLNHWTE